MALAQATRTQQDRVVPPLHPGAGRQFLDLCSGDSRRVELPVERLQTFTLAEAGFTEAAFQATLAAAIGRSLEQAAGELQR